MTAHVITFAVYHDAVYWFSLAASHPEKISDDTILVLEGHLVATGEWGRAECFSHTFNGAGSFTLEYGVCMDVQFLEHLLLFYPISLQ